MNTIGLLLSMAETNPEIERMLVAAAKADDWQQAIGLDRAARTKVRNAALIEAASVLSADGCCTWKTAQRLSDAIARFQSRVLPQIVVGAHSELTPSDRAIRRAWMTGERLPGSVTWLYESLLKCS